MLNAGNYSTTASQPFETHPRQDLVIDLATPLSSCPLAPPVSLNTNKNRIPHSCLNSLNPHPPTLFSPPQNRYSHPTSIPFALSTNTSPTPPPLLPLPSSLATFPRILNHQQRKPGELCALTRGPIPPWPRDFLASSGMGWSRTRGFGTPLHPSPLASSGHQSSTPPRPSRFPDFLLHPSPPFFPFSHGPCNLATRLPPAHRAEAWCFTAVELGRAGRGALMRMRMKDWRDFGELGLGNRGFNWGG